MVDRLGKLFCQDFELGMNIFGFGNELQYFFNFVVNSEANSRRINNVESCFGSSGQPLAVPGRVLVGEGVLTKMCRKKPKPRQFFLFNDTLVYGNIIINKKKVNARQE